MFCEAHGLAGRRDAGRQERACRTTIRSIWARSASPAPARPMRWREEADVVLAVGTRLQDFTTGSWALFKQSGPHASSASTVQPFDAAKHRALPLVADARAGLEELEQGARRLEGARRLDRRSRRRKRRAGSKTAARYTGPTNAELPSDAQVIGAVQRNARADRRRRLRRGRACRASCTRLWQAGAPGGYHMEYGYSCMGYEIAGGLGVKMADPAREVIVMVGDGSYLMMNSEIATSVMLGLKLTVVVLDNRGYGCINRLQRATGGESFNNLLQHTQPRDAARDRFRRPCRKPRRGRRSRSRHRRAGGRLRACAQRTTRTTRDRHRHRSARLDRCGRPLVGRGGAGSLGARGSREAARLRGRPREAIWVTDDAARRALQRAARAELTDQQTNRDTHDDPHRRQSHRLVQ